MAEEKNEAGNGSVAARNTVKKYTFSNNTWKSGSVPAGFKNARIQTFIKPKNIELAPIDRFYNHYNVVLPKVRVQFLTGRKYDENSKIQKTWTDLNSGAVSDESGRGADNLQNNFFVSMNIEDTGVKTLTLELFDRTFTTVQGYIYAAIKAANGIEGSTAKVSGKSSESVGGLTVEWAKMPSSIENNIRVDYGFEEDKDTVVPKGYWESMDLTNEFYQSDRNYRWVSRSSNQQVSFGEGSDEDNSENKRNNITSDKVLGYYRNQSTVASGFEYFYIVNYTSTLTDTGVKYTITATGTENMKLSGYKLVQQYTKITGTPLNVTASFMSLFNGSKMAKILWCDEYADFPIEEKKVLMLDGKYQAMDETQKKEKQESKALDVSELGILVENLKKCLGSLSSESGDSGTQKKISKELGKATVDNLTAWKSGGAVFGVSDKDYQYLCWIIENKGSLSVGQLGFMAAFMKKHYGKYLADGEQKIKDGTVYTEYLPKKFGISTVFRAALALMTPMAFEYDEDQMLSAASQVFDGAIVDEEKVKLANLALDSLRGMIGANNKGVYTSANGVGAYIFEIPRGFLEAIASDSFKKMFKATESRGYVAPGDAAEANDYSYAAKFLLENFSALDGSLGHTASTWEKLLKEKTGGTYKQAKSAFELFFNTIRSGVDNGSTTIENSKYVKNASNEQRFAYALVYALAVSKPSADNLLYFYFNEGSANSQKIFTAGSLSVMISYSLKKDLIGNSFYDALLVPTDELDSLRTLGELVKACEDAESLLPDEITWIEKVTYKKDDDNDDKSCTKLTTAQSALKNSENALIEIKKSKPLLEASIDKLGWTGQGKLAETYSAAARDDFENFRKRCEEQVALASKEKAPEVPSTLKGQLLKIAEIAEKQPSLKEKFFEGEVLKGKKQELGYLEKLYKASGSLDEKSLENLEKSLAEDIDRYSSSYNQARDVLNTLQQTKFSNEISINLGGPDSMSTKKTYYKNVSSLLNELCAQCPPWHDYEKEAQEKNRAMDGDSNATTYTDENGDEKSIDIKADCPTYRLTWELIGETADGVPVVGLSYQRPRKVRYVREYDWGNGNPKAHCIKALQISTNSEFAMLSSAARNSAKLDDNGNMTIEKGKGQKLVDLTGFNSGSKNIVGFFRNVDNTENYNARTTSLYNAVNRGTLTVLGDASLRFGGGIGPYTYPIFVNIKLQNEAAVWSDGMESQELGTTSALSGIYTISKITHAINRDGYTTTLEIMRYPGIDDLVKVM